MVAPGRRRCELVGLLLPGIRSALRFGACAACGLAGLGCSCCSSMLYSARVRGVARVAVQLCGRLPMALGMRREIRASPLGEFMADQASGDWAGGRAGGWSVGRMCGRSVVWAAGCSGGRSGCRSRGRSGGRAVRIWKKVAARRGRIALVDVVVSAGTCQSSLFGSSRPVAKESVRWGRWVLPLAPADDDISLAGWAGSPFDAPLHGRGSGDLCRCGTACRATSQGKVKVGHRLCRPPRL